MKNSKNKFLKSLLYISLTFFVIAFGFITIVSAGGVRESTSNPTHNIAAIINLLLSDSPPTVPSVKFSIPINLEAINPYAVVISDVNNDGNPDILAPSGSGASKTIHIYYGNGKGQFNQSSITVEDWPSSLAVADLNADGYKDLLYHSIMTCYLSVKLGTDNGSFMPKTDFQSGTCGSPDIITSDVNMDGKIDVILGNEIFLGDGSGGFSNRFTPSGANGSATAIDDVNNDGKPDLVTSYSDSGPPLAIRVNVLLGKGDTTFDEPISFLVPGDRSGSSSNINAIGDLNNDGNKDLVLSTGASEKVFVILGDGKGNFGQVKQFVVGDQIMNFAIGDLNGDGKLDLAAVSGSNVAVLLGDGKGNFGTATKFIVGTPMRVVIGDLNGDGKPDIVTGNAYSNTISVLFNETP